MVLLFTEELSSELDSVFFLRAILNIQFLLMQFLGLGLVDSLSLPL